MGSIDETRREVMQHIEEYNKLQRSPEYLKTLYKRYPNYGFYNGVITRQNVTMSLEALGCYVERILRDTIPLDELSEEEERFFNTFREINSVMLHNISLFGSSIQIEVSERYENGFKVTMIPAEFKYHWRSTVELGEICLNFRERISTMKLTLQYHFGARKAPRAWTDEWKIWKCLKYIFLWEYSKLGF